MPPSRDPAAPTRVEIVLDVDDSNPELLFIWVGARAVRLVDELRSKGIGVDIVSIDIDGRRHYRW